MSSKTFTIVCTLAGAVCVPVPSRAGDLASDVRAVFSAKCARCHGPQLSKPKSGFGYVLDLQRLAADPDKVVPNKPGESGLWQMVEQGEMPPPNSPSGPLTAAQKEVIRAWIAAGAPAEGPSPSADPPPSRDDPDEEPSPSFAWRTLLWLGKFHLVLVHFPIALLVAAAVAELWSVWHRSRLPSPAVRFCLALGAVSAVVVVGLGWLYALGGAGAGSPGLLTLHRWFGTTAAALAAVAALWSEQDARGGVRGWSTRVFLFGAVLLVGFTGHFGGLMVHGKDFYEW
jgi:hypothetical protein